MPRLLFDASSFVYALKLRRLEILPGSYIQWLTIYEALERCVEGGPPGKDNDRG